MALGFHNHPDIQRAISAIVQGAALAAADRFDIVVHGSSGHAAWPHITVDPLVAAAALVGQLQTVVSREVPPMYPAVVTVGMIQGGTTYNIIPDSCAIKGTVRTLHAEARDAAEAAIAPLCGGDRGRHARRLRGGLPPRRAVAGERRRGAGAHRRRGAQAVRRRGRGGPAQPGRRGFCADADLVPGFQLRVGSAQPGRADKLHNSDYQPDERCIGLGVQALSRAALEILAP